MPAVHQLSDAEQKLARTLIQLAKVGAQIYEGDYRAPWLLSPTIFCDIWSLRRNDGETRIVDGEVIGDRKFDWRVRLPNGGVLTDEKNSGMLQAMQRLAFLARSTQGGPNTLSTHLNFLWSLTFLARWVFLRESSLQPSRYAFSRLTHDHFCDLIRDLADGGVPFALQFPQRFLRVVYPLAIGRDPTAVDLAYPLALNEGDCLTVRAWLQSSGYLKKTDRRWDEPASVSLSWVAEIIETDLQTISNAKFSTFLTQFTSGPLQDNNAVVRGSADTRREYASHRAKTVSEVASTTSSEKTVEKYLTDLRTLVALHRHLPEACPDPSEFRLRQLNSLVAKTCRQKEVTPWVPLKTALGTL